MHMRALSLVRSVPGGLLAKVSCGSKSLKFDDLIGHDTQILSSTIFSLVSLLAHRQSCGSLVSVYQLGSSFAIILTLFYLLF